jgi:hypothetical protein
MKHASSKLVINTISAANINLILELENTYLEFGDQGFISVSYSSSVHNLQVINTWLIWRKNKIPHHSCEVPSRFFNWNNLQPKYQNMKHKESNLS